MEMVGKYEVSRRYGLVWAMFATFNSVTKTVALDPYLNVTEEMIDEVFSRVPKLC